MFNSEKILLALPDFIALAVIMSSCILFLRVAQKGYLKNYLRFLWAYLAFSIVACLFFVNDIIKTFHPENTEQYIPRWLDISEGVFIWLIPGLIIAKMIDKFFWSGIITDILKHPPPAILRYATYAIIVFSLVVAIVTNVFQSSMTGLLATSGLLAGIVGFAMQLNLSNMFAAIAINVDRPFTIGDWIAYKDIEGEVIKISWRATKIKTRNQNLVSIPNRSIIYEKVENFCAPQKLYAITIDIHVDASHPPFKVKERLKEACETCHRVVKGAPIRIFILEINDWSMTYRCLVPFENYLQAPDNQDNLWSSVWYSLANANIRFAVKKSEIDFYKGKKQRKSDEYEITDLLREMDIFTPLSDKDIDHLASGISERSFDTDTFICREGNKADSMYIIKQGIVSVTILGKSDKTIDVAKIGAGGFFGEISLFTGKPRTASVCARTNILVYEISKKDLEPILRAKPGLSKQFSKIILGRKDQLKSAFANPEQKEKDISDLVAQIARYFNIKAQTEDKSQQKDEAA